MGKGTALPVDAEYFGVVSYSALNRMTMATEAMMAVRSTDRLKKISLHPLTPEEAIRHALNAGPFPAASVNGTHGKPAKSKANPKPRKRVKKK
jgi:hypothetical protein